MCVYHWFVVSILAVELHLCMAGWVLLWNWSNITPCMRISHRNFSEVNSHPAGCAAWISDQHISYHPFFELIVLHLYCWCNDVPGRRPRKLAVERKWWNVLRCDFVRSWTFCAIPSAQFGWVNIAVWDACLGSCSIEARFSGFKKRMEWFINNRPEVSARNMADTKGVFSTDGRDHFWRPHVNSAGGREQRRLLALASKERLVKILEKMLDENEFLSEHGFDRELFCHAFWLLGDVWNLIRLSKLHEAQPWGMDVHGQRYEVDYWPGDSKSGMFGGNSNWRGPICESNYRASIWHGSGIGLATNFLLIESLQRFYQYYGDDLQVKLSVIFMSWILWFIHSIQVECLTVVAIIWTSLPSPRKFNIELSTFLVATWKVEHFRDYMWFHEVSIYCCNFCGAYFTLLRILSSATLTMDEDSVCRTKQGGQALLCTISSRVVSAVDCQKHRGVSWFDYCGILNSWADSWTIFSLLTSAEKCIAPLLWCELIDLVIFLNLLLRPWNFYTRQLIQGQSLGTMLNLCLAHSVVWASFSLVSVFSPFLLAFRGCSWYVLERKFGIVNMTIDIRKVNCGTQHSSLPQDISTVHMFDQINM